MPRLKLGQQGKKKKAHPAYKDMLCKDIPVSIRFDNFDKKAVNVLNEILMQTGADIVVSSNWREIATLDELGEYYLAQGIIKVPIGVTKFFSRTYYPPDYPTDRNNQQEQERSLEILLYLKEHPEITQWVSIDDLDMGSNDRDWGLDNFVWTPQATEGIKQTGKKQEVIKFIS